MEFGDIHLAIPEYFWSPKSKITNREVQSIMKSTLKMSLVLVALLLTFSLLLTGCGQDEINVKIDDNAAKAQTAVNDAAKKAHDDLASAVAKLEALVNSGNTASAASLTEAVAELNAAIEAGAETNAAIESLMTSAYKLGTLEVEKDQTDVTFKKVRMDAGEYVVVYSGSMANYCLSEISLLEDAARTGADLYITGDMKYHDALSLQSRQSGSCSNFCPMSILDIGHFSLEEEMMRRFALQLEKELEGVTVTFLPGRDPFQPLTFLSEVPEVLS